MQQKHVYVSAAGTTHRHVNSASHTMQMQSLVNSQHVNCHDSFESDMQMHECEFDAQEFKAEHDDDASTAWAI